MSFVNKFKQNQLLRNFSKNELEVFTQILVLMEKLQGELIFCENQATARMFFIWEGHVQIFRTTKIARKNCEILVASLKSVDSFGEMGIINGNEVRSASARALTDVKLYVLHKAKLNQIQRDNPILYSKFMKNLAQVLTQIICQNNEVILENYRKRVAMSNFFCHATIAFCFYTFALRFAIDFSQKLGSTTLVSVPLIIGVSILLFSMIKKSGYPLFTYGLTLKDWKKSALEAILWTIPFLVFLVAVKWTLVNTFSCFKDQLIFEFPQMPSPYLYVLVPILYVIFVPFQEFFIRGAIQSSLHEFLEGRCSNLLAIVFTSIIFSFSHLHLSMKFALVNFVPGLFFSYIYAQQRNLIGVSISHILVGVFALFFLNIKWMLSQ